MNKFHRPLSPHLTLYVSQLTSTFPISHRISGAFLTTMVLLTPILCPKMGVICVSYYKFYLLSYMSSKFISTSVDLTILALSFHLYYGASKLYTEIIFLAGKKIRSSSSSSSYRFTGSRIHFLISDRWRDGKCANVPVLGKRKQSFTYILCFRFTTPDLKEGYKQAAFVCYFQLANIMLFLLVLIFCSYLFSYRASKYQSGTSALTSFFR